jgi:glyoxylase-like metal-dependent hydrolase (beta-lactamase superfamily II)
MGNDGGANSAEWRVGRFRIRNLVETDASAAVQEIISQATPEAIAGIAWLTPHFADTQGKLKGVVQSFLVSDDVHRMVIDTCVGNDKRREPLDAFDHLQTDFLGRLSRLGWEPDTVTHVVCTHLHFDHVGWNTRNVGGQWRPTFPNARYVFCSPEVDYWRTFPEQEIEAQHSGIRDSVLPVVEAGLATFVEPDGTIVTGVTFLPTPGHTPGHCSVSIASNDERAIVTGDVMHHPCQIARPTWSTLSDYDPDLARESRQRLLASVVGTNTLVMGSHFAPPTAGRILPSDGGFELRWSIS